MNVTCPICFELFTSTNDISATPCGHVFHTECIKNWLQTAQNQCPECKKDCKQNQIIKLYFSDTGSENDFVMQLKNVIRNLLEQAKESELDFLKIQEEMENLKLENWKLEEINFMTKFDELSEHIKNAEKQVINLRSRMEKQKKQNLFAQPEDAATNFKLLSMATRLNDKDVFTKILDKFQDKNPKYIGLTALHVAAKWNRNEIFKLILDQTSDKNPRGFNRSTPLHIGM